MMGPPVFTRIRRLALDRLAAAKQTFAEMEEMGFCHNASSPWSSTLYIVLKKDGSPHCEGCLHARPPEGIFSGTHEPRRHPQDCHHHILWYIQLNFSCFGFRNAEVTFQHIMEGILGDLSVCVRYVDDILVFSFSKEEHLRHLYIMLDHLQKNDV
ncbi:uncharacterized protein [Palaemon carinicauda]|uniref:uncharacterized protein n=1 Tax=Palaemon carinicauda TaxID=392227 RepID=UPI0035B62732